eukprot:SAG31_NODE_1368_length_8614_cov_12.018203_6_plen_297_part_00
MLSRETGTIQEPLPGEDKVKPPYISHTQRAYQRHRSTTDLLLLTKLIQWRCQALGLELLEGQTDLAGAFDTVSHKAMDAAITEAGASPKTRNLFRLLYSSMTARVRARSANGNTHISRAYELNRGGAQGSVLMPLLFILTVHYLDKRHDTGRHGIYGPGELQSHETQQKCKVCERPYPRYPDAAEDGSCRSCQLLRLIAADKDELTTPVPPSPHQTRSSMTTASDATDDPQQRSRERDLTTLYDTSDEDEPADDGNRSNNGDAGNSGTSSPQARAHHRVHAHVQAASASSRDSTIR